MTLPGKTAAAVLAIVWLVTNPAFAQVPAATNRQEPLKPLQVPAKCEKKDKVKLANTGFVLIFLGSQLAKSSGIFERLCLEVELINTNTGTEGLLSKHVDFIESNAMEPVKTHAVGKSLLMVAPMTSCYTNSLVVRKEVVEKYKLTRNSPLKDRLAALKDLRIGLTNLGAGAGLWVLLLLDEAGLSAKDAKLFQLDNAPGMMAAFRTGQIDALSSGSPPGELLESEGLGYRLITGPGGDFPGFGPDSKFPYTAITTTREYAQANPDIVLRMTAAFMWANTQIQEDREQVRKIGRKTMFPNLPEPVYREAFDFTYPCFARPTDRFTQAAFDKTVRIGNLGRRAAGLPPVTNIKMEDTMTNRFLEAAAPAVSALQP